MTTPPTTLAAQAAAAARTCSHCGVEYADDDADLACPSSDAPDGTHQPTEKQMPVTSRVTIDMLDELGPDHPVGIVEIAHALGVRRQTVDVWRWRLGKFPDPQPTTLGSRPWWRWGDIRTWAVDTGRIVDQPADDDASGDDDAERVSIGAPRHPRTPVDR